MTKVKKRPPAKNSPARASLSRRRKISGSVRRLSDRKRQLTRDQIVQAAQALFVKHGYEQTSVQQIADAAGISRAGFFNYFSGKPELLRLMVLDMSQRFELLMEEQRVRPVNTRERLTDFINYSVQVIDRTQLFSRVLFMAFWQSIENPLDKRIALTKFMHSFELLLQDGITQGDVRTDISLPVLTQMVTAGFASLTNHWMNDPLYPLAERAREVSRYLCDAIAPRSP